MSDVEKASDSGSTNSNPSKSSIAEEVKKSSVAEQRPVYKGITSPINIDFPDKLDLEMNKSLKDYLINCDIYETQSDLYKKFDILTQLNRLAKKWIIECALTKNLARTLAERLGGHIRTFGSFRLGVHTKGGDIDALLVAPKYIERSDFFKSFPLFLKKQSSVSDLRCVENAFVPLIKFAFDGVDIDLLFARINMSEFEDNIQLLDDDLLRHLDIKCVRSLNGCRVADEILRQVPNTNVFISALQAIKLWAKKRAIYSNVIGFFGGITWAILVARVCQLYPNACASTVVLKFFFVYSRWSWPQPVLLKKVVFDSNIVNSVVVGGNAAANSLPQWNPAKNNIDKTHLMPIITPAYPNQNSTHNVCQSTKQILINEFGRASRICSAILKYIDVMSEEVSDEVVKIMREELSGSTTNKNKSSPWDYLFEGTSFFNDYKHYLMLSAVSSDRNLSLEWIGFVESKLRFFVNLLEKNKCIQIAHPNPKIYKQVRDSNQNNLPVVIGGEEVQNWFIGLQLIKNKKDPNDVSSTSLNKMVNQLDLTNELTTFNQQITDMKRKQVRFKSATNKYSIKAAPMKKSDLILYVPEDEIKQSDSFKKIERVGNAIMLSRQSEATNENLAEDPSNKNEGIEDEIVESQMNEVDEESRKRKLA